MNHADAAEALKQFKQERLTNISVDYQKADQYFDDIAKDFAFTEGKYVFIVVAHFVHTLPYFLYLITRLGPVARVIPKSSENNGLAISDYLKQLYAGIFVSSEAVNKVNLAQNTEVSQRLIQSVIGQYPNHRVIVLDHGGYFAPQLDALSTMSANIVGVVEHTANGDSKLGNGRGNQIQVRSVAKRSIKFAEDEPVAESIVATLESTVFSSLGVQQSMKTLNKMVLLGYGHIGRALALRLKKRLGDNLFERLWIIDPSPEARRIALADGYQHVHDLNNKQMVLKGARLVLLSSSGKVPALTQADLACFDSDVVLAGATSSDDLIAPDALAALRLESDENRWVNTYCYDNVRIHLVGKGGALNFMIGSTPHPILFAIFAYVCVTAKRLIDGKDSTHEDGKQIMGLYDRYFERPTVDMVKVLVRAVKNVRRVTRQQALNGGGGKMDWPKYVTRKQRRELDKRFSMSVIDALKESLRELKTDIWVRCIEHIADAPRFAQHFDLLRTFLNRESGWRDRQKDDVLAELLEAHARFIGKTVAVLDHNGKKVNDFDPVKDDAVLELLSSDQQPEVFRIGRQNMLGEFQILMGLLQVHKVLAVKFYRQFWRACQQLLICLNRHSI